VEELVTEICQTNKKERKRKTLRRGFKLKTGAVVEDGEKWWIDRGNEKTVTTSCSKEKSGGTDHVIIK
jgi:hypothetical protein